MHGLVIKNTGSWYTVRTDEGLDVDCKIKGNFRLKGIRSTNPVAVGDRVEIFGEHIPVSEIADALGTIPYEVLTSVSTRVKRVYYRE